MPADKQCIGCLENSAVTCSVGCTCLSCNLNFDVSASGIDYISTYADQDSLYFNHFKKIDHFQEMPIAELNSTLLPFELRLIALLNNIQAWRGLVDLGCGTGRFLRKAENDLKNVQGFEVATVLVDRLRQHGRKVLQGGIQEFLNSDLNPSAVTLLEVVEHLQNPGELIQEILTVKSPQLLAVVVPMWDIRRKFDSQFSNHDRPPNHLSWWDTKSLHALLNHRGYSVSIETIPEKRLELLKKLVKDLMRGEINASIKDWIRAFISPPPFWILGLAQKNHEN